jgi:hypothetical protein
MMLQGELQRVVELQRSWDSRNTPEMRERGVRVRRHVAAWFAGHRAILASAIGIPAAEFVSEGGDGSGAKARVPWTRFASRRRSSRPTEGFMVSVVWAFAPEDGVYLSLLQGTNDSEALRRGELVRKPLEQIRLHRQWAQDVVADWRGERDDLVPMRLGDRGERSAGRGYELGSIACIRYPDGAIPNDDLLLADALSFAHALGVIYRAGPPPSLETSSRRPERVTTVRVSPRPRSVGIQAGTTVNARDLDSGEGRTWTIVQKRDVAAATDLLSIESPIGQAMLGHDVGETVSVITPRGIRRYVIERCSPL